MKVILDKKPELILKLPNPVREKQKQINTQLGTLPRYTASRKSSHVGMIK